MMCIQLQCHHSLFSPSISLPKHNHYQPRITKLHTFTNTIRNRNTNEFLNYKQSSSHLRTKAISGATSSLVIGITSSASPPGDVTVLAQTGAVLLFVYWIANFVVPGMLMKDLRSDQKSNDQKLNDDDKRVND